MAGNRNDWSEWLSMPTDDAPWPLAGVRVLDLSRVMSGPFAGRLLSDLGADVVKLEPPSGDLLRKFGEVRHGRSGFYFQQNAGKRNVCVDLRVEGAGAVVADLAAVSDVVIENFRPGTLARYGLSYPELAERNPRLVMLSVTGFGQSGPWSDRQVYAPVIHAETGLVARQASFDGFHTDPVISLADSVSALHGLSGILAALFLRERTGRGQHIDLSMFDAMLVTDDYNHHAADQSPINRLGGDVFVTADGPLMVSTNPSDLWRRLGLDDGLGPEASRDEKIARRTDVMTAFFAGLSRADAIAAVERAGLGWGEVRDGVSALASDHARHHGTAAVVDDEGQPRTVVQSAWRFSDASSGVRGRAPGLGEHNAEVLAEWAGYDAARIQALVDDGVLTTTLEGTT